jgi:hypothetical protein
LFVCPMKQSARKKAKAPRRRMPDLTAKHDFLHWR